MSLGYANLQNITKPVLAGGGEISTFQNFFVRNLLLPPNSENTTEASLLEGVKKKVLQAF